MQMKRAEIGHRQTSRADDDLSIQILKGWYVRALRSQKGKIQGLCLWANNQEYAVQLPAYLRPLLVRELVPETAIQVWGYAAGEDWHAVNIVPLSKMEAQSLPMLPKALDHASPRSNADLSKPFSIQVCCTGKCFKQGSLDIVQALRLEASSNPNLQHIRIETVKCMKACKKGPNLRLSPSGNVVHHATSDVSLLSLSEVSYDRQF
jgi:hypothetical protein